MPRAGPTATRKFSYDYAGRVTSESLVTAGRTYWTRYTWDANGNMKTLRYPNGRLVTFTYDLADRVTKAIGTKSGNPTRTYFDSTGYLPFGPDTTMWFGNGVKVKKSYDKRYYTQSITNTPAGIFGRSYQYDHNGNITQLLDLIDSTKSYHTITYDGVDRLLTAFGDYRTDDLTYSYAKNGNRLTKQKGASSTSYSYLNNRLRNTTGAEVVNYGYNANGSVIGDTLSGQTKVYTYDKLNRIVKITGIAPTDSFTYDGENKRVYSNDNGTELVNLYDIYGNLISQYFPGAPFYTTDYIWANGEPRMRIDTLEVFGFGPSGGPPPPSGPETRYWFHTDHLGTPYVLTDSLKIVQWRVSLDPFGETVSEFASAIEDNTRFPGQRIDRGSGLNYNWHRYYQPKIGRYYQVDPVTSQTTTNPFSYVSSNPLVFTDRTGEIGRKAVPLITAEEFRVFTGIPCALNMREAATIAADRTKKIAEELGVLDGKRDAFKHCLGICSITKICGADVATAAAVGKEVWDLFREKGNLVEKAKRLYMDTHNNWQGSLCSKKASCGRSFSSCANCCLTALNNGSLFVINKDGDR
ncbi:MAG TPA: RHS repeat-associated core domain-containing protein [Verrucomicrobiae bacterium]|nr:RHS repeat-associated core domain-containing protein [Verrucomicrobiae bacterium]